MAIDERIHFFRTRKGLTQKALGILAGFPERSADVRMAQYENGSRTPKEDLTKKLADIFDVSPSALTVPDIDSYKGLMHTLFTLEDVYGLTPECKNGDVEIRIDLRKGGLKAIDMLDYIRAWAIESDKFRRGEISQEEYDRWRYRYPEYDTSRRWVKVMSPVLSNFITGELKKEEGSK
jgi:transcriptional regulator with XRE-family HTH domain